MKAIILLVIFSLLGVSLSTPLDDYVNAPDPTYKYTVVSQWKGLGYTAYAIDLISQTWLTPDDSDTSVWRHWLTVCVPDKMQPFSSSALYIDGGPKKANPPTELDPHVEILCVSSGTVVSNLGQIPPQPFVFASDPERKRRSEDAAIAFTWWRYLTNTTNPNWLIRLPMTKAVVRAMDTVQSFTSTISKVPKITGFAIAGASKRGWTAWTTASVDKRVIGLIPLVMPIPKMIPAINQMYQAYGYWSFALEDYTNMKLLNYLNEPEFQMMADIIDPYTYFSRLTMPKYIVSAAGDEFFLPDTINHSWKELPEPKFLRIVPDAEHSLLGSSIDIVLSIETFYNIGFRNLPYPKMTWELFQSNTTAKIVAHIPEQNYNPKLDGVYMWYATTLSATERDFRLINCWEMPKCLNPVLWYYQKLDSQGNGRYVATMNAPTRGWGGFFIEAIFSYDWPDDHLNPKRRFRITTEANIVPERMPFPPCGKNCQPAFN